MRGADCNEARRSALGRTEAGEVGRRVDLHVRARQALDAIRLTELGARAGLVSQLTGLEKGPANRLYREVHGGPSPSGQQPFTDTWFRRSDRRMLHASLVWRLYDEFPSQDSHAAQALIAVYECYRWIVCEPLLDITRTAFVPRLIAMGLWQERVCRTCRSPYVAPVDQPTTACPACRIYLRRRSRSGNTRRSRGGDEQRTSVRARGAGATAVWA